MSSSRGSSRTADCRPRPPSRATAWSRSTSSPSSTSWARWASASPGSRRRASNMWATVPAAPMRRMTPMSRRAPEPVLRPKEPAQQPATTMGVRGRPPNQTRRSMSTMHRYASPWRCLRSWTSPRRASPPLGTVRRDRRGRRDRRAMRSQPRRRARSRSRSRPTLTSTRRRPRCPTRNAKARHEAEMARRAGAAPARRTVAAQQYGANARTRALATEFAPCSSSSRASLTWCRAANSSPRSSGSSSQRRAYTTSASSPSDLGEHTGADFSPVLWRININSRNLAVKNMSVQEFSG